MEFAGELTGSRIMTDRLIRYWDRGSFSVRFSPADKPLLRRKEFLLFLVLSWILALCYLYPYVSGLTDINFGFCVFRRVTGIPCLFCGMTRSMIACAHLRLQDAFYYHLLGPFIFFVLIGSLLGLTFPIVTGKRVEIYVSPRARRWFPWSLLALFIAAWVAKLVFFGANV